MDRSQERCRDAPAEAEDVLEQEQKLPWESFWRNGPSLRSLHLPANSSAQSQGELSEESAVFASSSSCTADAESSVSSLRSCLPASRSSALELLAALVCRDYAAVREHGWPKRAQRRCQLAPHSSQASRAKHAHRVRHADAARDAVLSQVEKLLGLSISSDSHDVCVLQGKVAREVHHFWAEGLAVHLREGRVVAVEALGDHQQFHRRAPQAELFPGIRFGASTEEVIHVMGAQPRA